MAGVNRPLSGMDSLFANTNIILLVMGGSGFHITFNR
jgi:hypothetical protein